MSFIPRAGSTFSTRPLALLGATALSVGAMVPLAGAASADNHVQDLAPACEGLTDPVGFLDIAFLSQNYQDAINCMAHYDITQGRTPTQYAPNLDVKRYEMALFISRSIDYIESASDIDVVDADEAEDAGFDDLEGVPAAGVQAINRLAQLDIVEGKVAGEVYAPFDSVNRRDMARFINRLQAQVIEDPYTAEGAAGFSDVPATLAGSADIFNLQAAGIVQGTGAGTYEPFRDVRRADMALYIMRHLADNIEAGNIASLVEEPVESNENLEFGPDDAVSITLTADEDTRSFLATGLEAGTYDVILVDSADADVSTDGVVTFVGDEEGIVAASAIAEVVEVSNGGVPVNGTLTATIEGFEAGSVIPVLYLVTTPDAPFTVDENGRPTRDFGVAGETAYVYPPPATRTFTAVKVEAVEKDVNRFEGSGSSYAYDANDSFFTADGDGLVAVSLAQFEAALTPGDEVSGNYRKTVDFLSTFVLSDIDPAKPTVTATAGIAAGSENDISITVSPAGDDWDSVVLDRATVTEGAAGPYATIATLTAADDEDAGTAGIQYTDADLAAGTYSYRAAVVNHGDPSEFAIAVTATASESTIPDLEDATSPVAVDTVMVNNMGNKLLLDANDVFAVAFDKAHGTISGGDTIRVSDVDGTIADIVNRVGGTSFALNDAVYTIGGRDYQPGHVLLVSVGSLSIAAAGEVAGVDLPARITDQSGAADVIGNDWKISSGGDLEIDEE